MKLLRNFKKVHIIIALTVVLSFFLINIVLAGTAEPGTDEDPVVSKSYVDDEIDKLNARIVELTAIVDGLSKRLEEQGSTKFEVVELKAGKRLIAGESTEIIVRAGQATAISGKNGDGLSDITTDDPKKGNLTTGQTIPLNHLLLVSRDDGRGLKAVSSKVYMLVKGIYEIK